MPGSFGSDDSQDGVVGTCNTGGKSGVFGFNPAGGGNGVAGISQDGNGVFGKSSSLNGVFGESDNGSGVHGRSNNQFGVYAFSGQKVAVRAESKNGTGIEATSDSGIAITARAGKRTAVEGFAHAADQTAIFGMNAAGGSVPSGLNRVAGAGVWGHTKVEEGSGVVGSVEPGLSKAAGVTGIGAIAGRFFGDVEVTGDVKLLGADIAERFLTSDYLVVEPGTVMVMKDTGLAPCCIAYDGAVVGVVSGAGDLRPGVSAQPRERRRPCSSRACGPSVVQGRLRLCRN